MSELVIIEPELLTPEIFQNNAIESLITNVRSKVRQFEGDVTTESGRKEIASFAYKIARSKTAVDDIGKEEVAQYKTKAKVIDDKRKLFRDHMDALKDEVRKPLTDFEEAEKQRVATHKENISEIIRGGEFSLQSWQELSVEAMQDRLKEVTSEGDRDWQEFSALAKESIEKAMEKINTAIEKRKTYDAEQAELVRLRQAQIEREQKDREERIAKEAEERAKREAEETARKVAAKVEAEKLQAMREKEEAEKARIAAIEEERQKSIREKEIAEQRIKEAEERANREIEAAKAEEKRRIEQEKAEIAKREADKKHREKIKSETILSLKTIDGVNRDLTLASKIFEAISNGEIANVKVVY